MVLGLSVNGFSPHAAGDPWLLSVLFAESGVMTAGAMDTRSGRIFRLALGSTTKSRPHRLGNRPEDGYTRVLGQDRRDLLQLVVRKCIVPEHREIVLELLYAAGADEHGSDPGIL